MDDNNGPWWRCWSWGGGQSGGDGDHGGLWFMVLATCTNSPGSGGYVLVEDGEPASCKVHAPLHGSCRSYPNLKFMFHHFSSRRVCSMFLEFWHEFAFEGRSLHSTCIQPMAETTLGLFWSPGFLFAASWGGFSFSMDDGGWDTPKTLKENLKMMVWKMILLFQGCILRLHVNLLLGKACLAFKHDQVVQHFDLPSEIPAGIWSLDTRAGCKCILVCIWATKMTAFKQNGWHSVDIFRPYGWPIHEWLNADHGNHSSWRSQMHTTCLTALKLVES